MDVLTLTAKIVVVLVLVLFSVTSMAISVKTGGLNFSSHYQESPTELPSVTAVNKALLTSTPINIDGNAELQSLATSGDGTSGNPYIIENYSISNLGAWVNGVTVSNTDKFFLLRNISVDNCSNGPGFYFDNVTSGSIIDCSATNNYQGFSLFSSSTNTLISNNASNNNWIGFVLYISSNNNN